MPKEQTTHSQDSEVKANAETRAALEEGDQMLADPNTRKFYSVEELFEELESE